MPTRKVLSGKKRKNKTKKRKFTTKEYPYKNHNKEKALDNFLKFKAKKQISSNSLLGIATVDYGTERARIKTKYRNKSLYERWNDPVARKKMIKFAKRLKKQDLSFRSFLSEKSENKCQEIASPSLSGSVAKYKVSIFLQIFLSSRIVFLPF